MKRLYCLLLTSIMVFATCFASYAGTWTHTTVYGDGTQGTYDSLWFYIKDDGTYAKSEWIVDTDGTRYWIDWSGSIGSAGIADDGIRYNCEGKVLDFSDPAINPFPIRFLETFSADMNYDQLVASLGKEHCVQSYGSHSTLCWHTEDMDGELEVDILQDGSIYSANFYKYYRNSQAFY